MLKLTTYDAPIAHTARTVGEADVVATKFGQGGTPQSLRSVLTRTPNADGTITLHFGMPKSAKPTGQVTVKPEHNFLVVGNVSAYPTASKASTKVRVKDTSTRKPSERKAAPVKGTPKAAPKADAAPKTEPTLREAIRAELRTAVQTMVLQEVKAVIAEALA